MKKLLMGCILCLTIILQPVSAGWINGKVLDYYGTTPVSGVSVRCLEYYGTDTNVYSALTASDGSYRLEVPSGVYLIAVNPNESGKRYIPQYYGGANSYYWSYTLEVGDTDDLSDINFYLWAGNTVSGTVLSDSGAPAEAALLAYDNTTGLYYWGLSGAESAVDGTFTMNLPQGVYTFLAYRDGDPHAAESFPVCINDDRNDIAIQFKSTGAISGTVKDAQNNPLVSIRVDALDVLNGYSYGYATTDDQGNFTISDLQQHRSYFILARPAFQPDSLYPNLPGTFFPEATTPGQAEQVDLSGSEIRNIAVIVPSQSGSVTGVVRDLDGNPISGAYVYDFYYPGIMNAFVAISQRSALTDENGQYTLNGLGPGQIGIAVTASDYVPQIWNGKNMTTLLSTGDPITITNGQTVQNIDFELTPTASLGDAPTLTSISPHLILKTRTVEVLLTGTGFSDQAHVDFVDMYPLHPEGQFPVITAYQVVSTEEIHVTVQTDQSTAPGPYFLAVTNPDGQYFLAGFSVIHPMASAEISILSAPMHSIPDSTWSLGLNMQNLTMQDVTVDAYIGIALPTSDVIFYDGTNFSTDVIKYLDGQTLASGYFLPQSLLFTLPLDGAVLPPGEYVWVAALTGPGSYDIIDVSVSTIYIN